MQDFLPVTREDMKSRGWDELDFVYVTGDAYVDHPSFGHAIITRLLEAHGYRVCIMHSQTGGVRRALWSTGSQDLAFLYLPGIWIPW